MVICWDTFGSKAPSERQRQDGCLERCARDWTISTKCENILLCSNNQIKIADFGFARFLPANEMSTTFCGSAAYAAPELLQGLPYQGPKVDIWSLGVILYIMICSSMPFRDTNIKTLLSDQVRRNIIKQKFKLFVLAF